MADRTVSRQQHSDFQVQETIHGVLNPEERIDMTVAIQPRKKLQAGTVILLLTIAMPALLGIAALAVEGASLRLAHTALRHAADAAALAAALDLPDALQASQTGYEYAMLNSPGHGEVLGPSDVISGNWDFISRSFTAAGAPLNAVQVTAYRTVANGNPVPTVLARAFGKDSFDIIARAVAVAVGGGTGTSSRFLIDSDMIDTDVESIEDLAEQLNIDKENLISDLNDDGYIDLPPGTQLDVPTGEIGDEALFDISHPAFPFLASSDPSFEDFLNYNEDGTWRQELLQDGDLDPLLGPSPLSDGSLYAQLLGLPCQVSPVYKSDISELNPVYGIPAVNAKGERRGLMAFKIVEVLDDPDGSGSRLPNIRIEICAPIDPSVVTPGPSGGGGNASALVL
jgi:hypothetical protein